MESYNPCDDDHFVHLSSTSKYMLNTSHFSDVTLAVDGRVFKAHKVILAICSPYFKKLFLENCCQNDDVTLCLFDVKHEIMQALLAFMYEGKVQIPADELSEFVNTAIQFQIKGIKNNQWNDGFSHRPQGPQRALSTAQITTDLNKGNSECKLKTVGKMFDFLPCLPPSDIIKKEIEEGSVEDHLLVKVEDISMIDVTSTEIQYPLDKAMENSSDYEDDDPDFQCSSDTDTEEDLGDSDEENTDYASYPQDHLYSKKEGSSKLSELKLGNVVVQASSHCEGEKVSVRFIKTFMNQKNYGIMVDGSRYSPNRANRWVCTIRGRTKCKAGIVLTNDKRIVFVGKHNHGIKRQTQLSAAVDTLEESYITLPFSRWRRSKAALICEAEQTSMESSVREGELVTVSFIKSPARPDPIGLLVHEQRYTLLQTCKRWTRWQCTWRPRYKCAARIILTNDQQIIFVRKHNHERTGRCDGHVDSQRTFSVLLYQHWCSSAKKSMHGKAC